MIVIVCLDETGGMLFHHRRQSRDRAVTGKIQKLGKEKKLWMNSYSYSLYKGLENVEISVSEDFLSRVGEGELCLVETEQLKQVEEKIEELIVFRWDKKYPADFHLDLDLSKWKRTGIEEFCGTSHEKIRLECYKGEPL